MVCQRYRGLLVCKTFDELGSSQAPYTLPHVASIVGVSRMPSFVRIASTDRKEREVSHAGAGPSKGSIDSMNGQCGYEYSSDKKL